MSTVLDEPFIRFEIIATPEPAAVPPRVRVDVLDRHLSSTEGITLTRLDPDGRTRAVRTVDGGPLVLSGPAGARTATVYDYETPSGAPVTYSTQEEPALVSAPITLADDRVWLIDIAAPALSHPIWVVEIGPRRRRVERALLQPMGRRTPIPHTDGQRKAPEYDLTVRTGSIEELTALETLLDDAQVVLLKAPATNRWGIGTEYISVGDLVEKRLQQYGPDERRHWDLPCTVVDRPEGGTTATRTLGDLADEAPTLGGLADMYDTLYEMAVGL